MFRDSEAPIRDVLIVGGGTAGWATVRRVIRILDEIAYVPLDETGAIGGGETMSGQSLCADLYIDCTGLRGLLINQALGEPFMHMNNQLFCDSAIAAPLTYDNGESLEPYTSAIAMKAGWIWKIPLLSRIGSGYVYSSQFISEDEASREYCQLWGLDDPQRLCL